MPRDTQGNYSLPNGYRAVTGQKVLASQHNPPLEDLASNMTGSVARNGTSPMLADMPMGGHKITDMADGVANNDGATVGQVPAAVASVSPSLVAKDVPDDADLLVISDSADSNKPKKLSWANLRAALKTYFDTLYTLAGTAVQRAGDAMTGPLTLPGKPTAANQAATKSYVDDLSIGVGQTWQDVTGSRAIGTVYQNTTGRPIFVNVNADGDTAKQFSVSPDNSAWITIGANTGFGRGMDVAAVIPDGWYYRVTQTGSGSSVSRWGELR